MIDLFCSMGTVRYPLCDLCELCASVVDLLRKHSPQRHRAHGGRTEISIGERDAVYRTLSTNIPKQGLQSHKTPPPPARTKNNVSPVRSDIQYATSIESRSNMPAHSIKESSSSTLYV